MASENGETVIRLEGALTLVRAEAVRDTLLAALCDGRDILIDCSPSTEIDLSAIQIFLACRVSAMRRGLSVRVKAPAESPLTAALRSGGLTGVPASSDTPIWTEGD